MVVAARLLDLGQFADLALGAALSAIAVQIADVGVGIQLPQAFAGQTQGLPVEAIRQAFRRRLGGGLAVAPLTIVAFVTVASTRSFAVAAGFAVSTIATSVYGVGYVALRAIDANGLEAALEPSGRLLVLALGTICATSGLSLAWIAWSYALADILALGMVGVVIARRRRGSESGPRLGRVTWLGAAGPIGMVYWRADIWLLAALATSRQVALYGSAYRLLDAALLPALVLAQLFAAPFARCPAEQRLTFVRRWVRGSFFLMLPFALVASVLGGPLLTTLFGPDFAGATRALALLGMAAPLTAVAFVLTTALATLAPRCYVGVAAIALGANLVANVLFAARFGASGAAAATVASQVVLIWALWAAVRRHLAPLTTAGHKPAIAVHLPSRTVLA
jgi:O-antigen/teichoic acid export membrane protein